MITQCFYRNLSKKFFALAYLCVAWQIQPTVPFPIINIISQSVINSNFTPVVVKHACHANLGTDTKYVGSR